MADRKISDLTALTTPASGDYLPIVDISEAAASSKNKRITIEELFRGVPLGTAAAPSIAIEGDENTGIYSPGADQLAISTNGTGRLFVDASGTISLGSTSTAASPTIYSSSNPTLNFNDGTNSSYAGLIGTENRFINFSSGGTTLVQSNSTINLNVVGSNNFTVGTANTERLRITSDGKLGLGTTAPAHKLTVSTGVDTDAGDITIGLGSVTAGATRQATITKNTTSPFSLTFAASNGGTSVDTIFKRDGTNESARIDNNGRLLVGTSSARSNVFTLTPFVQYEGTGEASRRAVSFGYGQNDGAGAILALYKTRGGVGSNTAVVAEDSLASIRFAGADGTNVVEAARIEAAVDGTPGANDMPGRLVFSTTPDASATPAEVMRITSNKYVRLASGTGGIQFNGDTAAANALDDYEEGTWTPVASRFTGGSITATYTSQTGKYTKIGRVVTVECYIQIASVASQGSSLSMVTGLPFTPISNYQSVGAVYSNTAATTVAISSVAVHSSNVLYFHENTNNDSNAVFDWKSGVISFSVSYAI